MKFLLFYILFANLIIAQTYNYSSSNPKNDKNQRIQFLFQNEFSITNTYIFEKVDSLKAFNNSGDYLNYYYLWNSKNQLIERKGNYLINGFEETINPKKRFYDDQNLLTEEIELYLTAISLNPTVIGYDTSIHHTYEYSENKSVEITRAKNGGIWELWNRTTEYMDPINNDLTRIYEIQINRDWVKTSMDLLYLSPTNQIDSIKFYDWTNQGWQQTYKSFTYYNSESKRDSAIAYAFRDGNWEKSLKRHYLYPAINQFVEIESFWESGQWDKQQKLIYNLNEYGNVISVECEIWKNNDWIHGKGNIHLRITDDVSFVASSFSDLNVSHSNSVTDVNTNELKIKDYSLSQNYPNPFNPSTNINFTIPESGNVKIYIYNILGKKIITLLDKNMNAGSHQVTFNSNHVSSSLPSGIYFYKITSNKFSQTKKMMLLK